MLDDLIITAAQAALGGAKGAQALIEAELKRMRESGALPAAEVDAIAKEARAAFEARSQQAKEVAGPVVEAARSALREALGVPSREELADLTARLERAVAALEKAQRREPS
jgi:hypothetical protein